MRAFINGRIRTGDPELPWATALVVDDAGLIVHVGGDDQIGRDIEHVDLGGGFVLPGFIDAHVHPKMAGLQIIGGTLVGQPDVEGYWGVLRSRLTEGGESDWVVLAGYAAIVMAQSGATRATLDSIAGSRPVVLVNSDLHGGLVNSAVLSIAGFEHGGGYPSELVEVDADGVASGYLNEEALNAVLALAPPASEETLLAAVRAAQAHLHSVGVVGWHDALVGDQHGLGDSVPRYIELHARGELTARVTGAYGWNRARGVEQIEAVRAYQADVNRSPIKVVGVKLLLDGVNEAHTAAMLHPYSDASGHLHDEGPSLIGREALIETVVALDAVGLDVHMHAVGDRAVRDGLDAVEAARRANGYGEARHQIAHALFVSDADVPRFAELDVTLDNQGVWSAADFLDVDGYAAMVGDEVMQTFYRYETLHATGLRWSAGSDWPVSSPAPLDGITAATRRALAPGAPAHDGWERLSAETVITAYTSGSAYSSRLPLNGTLRVGMNADFVRLSGDPTAVDYANTLTVEETVIGGKPVFRADD
ncbi:amidohydrolase [uncultured Microbacterium sp.]|uniref:amidohydrolase n=1 Tax=uncultured Microbacterium sp. TaxID=191216 RepID=UPI0025D3F5E6|nr:amidohydrolase [uncultured Microbacterium sp.]